ncbi:tyrosine protein phosphatase [Streptomyces tateyamensis]|uniref:Tyrosine protein phosphatase n=1 Tax=Streptomyces tateyamensis TaxID=565073 RepID=A0A2V4NRY3_9ACTN|nr:tyrosine-protein phosphatase [Streptomyces tateyamensis]PYC83808.1 tyrosine protein phosphatase [Streptomyces tateyamensis]
MTDLQIAGLRNAREVLPGRLYRSATLSQLTPAGAAALGKLGLRTVIDLRDPAEVAHWPAALHDLELDLVNLPMLPQDTNHRNDPLPAIYLLLAETGGPALVAVIRRLLAPGALPALVHCAVGKDGTGVTVAVLLELLGVPQEEVLADYLASNPGLGLHEGPVEYLDEHGNVRVSNPVQAELLNSVLDRIREQHGSVEAYLLASGLTAGELAELRELLAD